VEPQPWTPLPPAEAPALPGVPSDKATSPPPPDKEKDNGNREELRKKSLEALDIQ
jgi:hypothetical protein